MPWFEEVSRQAGVVFRHGSGHSSKFYMPEMVTGGVGLLDFDGDGLLDLYCVNGGSLHPSSEPTPGHKLFRNLGNWRFEDVTARARVGGNGGYGMGVACGDFDNDGWSDLLVTQLNGCLLLRNSGDGTFADVTQSAGVTVDAWGTSAAWVDYDADGHLDLLVANYLRWSRETELNCYSRGGRPDYCSPLNYKAPAMDTLYRNLGDGTFTNVTASAGLDRAYGNGLGVVCADFDQDNRIDLFVANDGVPNQLWMNQGAGRFVDEALIRGCSVNAVGMPRAGMGVVAIDTFQRGSLDLFITHLVGEGNGWFVNTKGNFVDTLGQRSANAGSLPLTGFGVCAGDFDLDGALDLYVANGRVKFGARDLDPQDPYAEPNTLLRGLGGGQFEEVRPTGGTDPVLLASSRGAAVGDLDNDGRLDLVVVNKDGPLHVLRNNTPLQGGWVMFRLLNRKGTESINASIQILAGGRTQYRDAIPNQGYCSSQDPRVHFGVGNAAQVDEIRVRWPSGLKEHFGPLPLRTIHVIREGTGRQPNPTGPH